MVYFKYLYVLICSYLCSCYNVYEVQENELTVRPNYVLESGACFKALAAISYLDCVRHLKDGKFSFNVMVYRRRFLLCRLCFVTKALQIKKEPGFVLVHKPITDTSEENLALRKPTNQSSTYSDLENSIGYAPSDLAVDGNNATTMRQPNGPFLCAHTTGDLEDNWWMVDLENIYPVSKVVFVSRIEECCWEWFGNLTITVGETKDSMKLCAEFIGPPDYAGQTVTNNCTEPMLGQFVRISKSKHFALVLCEVEVYR